MDSEVITMDKDSPKEQANTEMPEKGSFLGLMERKIEGGKITHHTLNELSRWTPSQLTKQGLVDVDISVCGRPTRNWASGYEGNKGPYV